MPNDTTRPLHHSDIRTSVLLQDMATATDAPTVTLGDFATHMRERSFGLLLLITAVLGWIPVLPPGVASIFGVAILLLAGQMVLGRVRPWLPAWLAKRGVKREAFATLVKRLTPWLQRVERISRPRLHAMTGRVAERFLAGYICVLALLICIPLPMTNAFPALAVAILAIALIQQDGFLIVFGVVAGIAAVVIMTAFWGGAYLGIRWATAG